MAVHERSTTEIHVLRGGHTPCVRVPPDGGPWTQQRDIHQHWHAVVGGFGSLPGAIVGGFTVGLFETACSFFISGSHKDAYAFLLMVVVLLIKPTGFFGVQVKMKA